MTQYNLPVFASPTPGRTFLKDNLEPWRDAVHSMHAGVTRPDYVVPQMMWIDTSATPWVLKVFQGSDDIVLGNLDPVTLDFTPSAVDSGAITGILASNVTATNTNGLASTNVQGQLDEIATNAYSTYPIGLPFMTFHSSLVPSNSGTRKFILLTAGQTGAGQYNEGLLVDSVGGTFPTNTATGEILVGPLAGVSVELVNSTRRALIGGTQFNQVEDDQMQKITGSLYQALSRSVTPTETEGAFDHEAYSGGSSQVSTGTGVRFNNSLKSISVTGDYEDLTNKPVMFSGSYTDLSNTPTFHDICFSGSYLDLLDTPLAVDMDEIFTRLDDLDDFIYRKMPAIPNVTNAPVATSVTILGIQIPSANSFSNLIGDYNDLRDSHNRLLSAARSWGWLDS